MIIRGGAINRLTNGLEWKQGDEVVINSLEFPSNTRPFLALKQLGVTIIDAEVRDGAITVDAIEKAITLRTKIVSISFVQFLSGYRADLRAIGELCRKRGIIFCVDAIQGLGAVPLDVDAMKIDFLASASHKWMMAPEGLGIMYLTEELQSRLHPSVVGWTSVENAWDLLSREFHLRGDARRYEHGILNMPAVIGLKAALELFFEIGMENVTDAVLARSKELVEGLSAGGYELCCKHVHDKERAGIVSFRTKGAPEEVVKRLEEKNIIVTARSGWLRVSPHFYCTSEDVEKFFSTLKDIE